MIDEDAPNAELARPSRTMSPDRTDAMKQQIRDGRPIFQAEMLACGAIPLDGIAPSEVVADSVLTNVAA